MRFDRWSWYTRVQQKSTFFENQYGTPPRNLYIGQLEQDETKNDLIGAVLVLRNEQNILQGKLAKNTKKILDFQFFGF